MLLNGDLTFHKSERMRDTDDGGGRVVSALVDGSAENQIHDDIPPIARQGSVIPRKVFASVDTADDQPLLGSGVIVARPCSDPASTLTIMEGTAFDVLSEAKDRLTAYYTKSGLSAFNLLSLQPAGAKNLQIFGLPNLVPPTVGDVFYLVEDEGLGTEFSEYVRVASVDTELREFIALGDDADDAPFTRLVVSCELSDALEHTYTGPEVTKATVPTGVARMRTVVVSDAVRIHGVSSLTEATTVGQAEVKTDGIRQPIVPAAQTPVLMTDSRPSTMAGQEFSSGGFVHTVYAPPHSRTHRVTLATQRQADTFQLNPLPAASSSKIEYRALQQWHTITATADGTLTGAGAGYVNHTTGSLGVTYQYLPDLESDVILSWTSPGHFADRSGVAAVERPSVTFTLAGAVDTTQPCTVTWEKATGGTATATRETDGTLSGDATGRIVALSGEGFVQPLATAVPSPTTNYTVTYRKADRVTETAVTTPAGGFVEFNMTQTPVRAGSVIAYIPYTYEGYSYADGSGSSYTYSSGQTYSHSSASGGARGPSDYYKVSGDTPGTPFGKFTVDPDSTIDYASGHATISATLTASRGIYSSNTSQRDDSGQYSTWAYSSGAVKVSGNVQISYQVDTAVSTDTVEVVAAPPIRVTFLAGLSELGVPGTYRFSLGGHTYNDAGGTGTLWDEGGVVAGEMDYTGNAAVMSQATLGDTGGWTVNVLSLVSQRGRFPAYELAFRVAITPLSPGSLSTRVTDMSTSELLTSDTDASGNFTGADTGGRVDHEQGAVWLRYGDLVQESTLTPEQRLEWWYDADDIDLLGNIWLPRMVDLSTLFYNGVGLRILPLQADLIGLQPVRLPADGKLQVIHAGNPVLIHHTLTSAFPTGLSGGETLDVGRGRITVVKVIDSSDADEPDKCTVIAPSRYTTDRYLGRVTLETPFSLAGLVEPIRVVHRIEDLRLVSTVHPDGTVGLLFPTSYAFPVGTLVSSIMYGGTRRAYVTNVFSQETWTGEFSDTLIGDPAVIQLNETLAPVVVHNRSAETERYALVLQSPTTYNLIGEKSGLIGGGSTLADYSPVNPLTGLPLLTIPALAFSGGGQAGNAIRLNAVGAGMGVWVILSITPSDILEGNYDYAIEQFGGTNTED